MTTTLVLSVVMLLVCVALFVKSYQDVGPKSRAQAGPGVDSAVPSGLPDAGTAGTADPRSNFFPSGAAPLPGKTLTPAEPGGLVIGKLPTHALLLRVTAAGPVGKLGYLAPTSPDASYGIVTPTGANWSLRTTVLGRPHYAAIFVQSGASGTAITCTVSVDGVVTDTKTTSGAYGRTVCVG
jgi:hypothetical protein